MRPIMVIKKPYTCRNNTQGWHKETIPAIIVHIEMGSKYFALKCLNILDSLLPDGPECDASQKMFSQKEGENSHREEKYECPRGDGRPVNHAGSQL